MFDTHVPELRIDLIQLDDVRGDGGDVQTLRRVQEDIHVGPEQRLCLVPVRLRQEIGSLVGRADRDRLFPDQLLTRIVPVGDDPEREGEHECEQGEHSARDGGYVGFLFVLGSAP